MSRKNWIICGDCNFFSKCKAGQNKMQNVEINSKIYFEIGCYEYEQYYLSADGRQLKLF